MIRPVAEIQPDSLEADLLRAARELLPLTFGSEFEYWVQDAGWSRVVVSGTSFLIQSESSFDLEPAGWKSALPESLLDVAAEPQSPPRLETCDDTTLVAIPLRCDGVTAFIAVGRFRACPPEMLLRLAEAFLREFAQRRQLLRFRQELEQSRQENESFVGQISDYLEELTFLREMLVKMDLAEATVDLRQMGESLLPPLADAIKAESLLLVLAEQDLASPTAIGVGRIAYWAGDSDAEDAVPNAETCQRLVDAYRQQATDRPLVRNHIREQSGEFPAVHDFVLACVSKGDRTVGWLLAVNRLDRDADEHTDLQHRVGRCEFGSEEASLLGSTASLLATQVRNFELFREKERLLVNVVRAIVSAVDAKDRYTVGKSERVAQHAARIGRQLGLPDEACDRLFLTGLLHDIGTLGVSDATMRKPGRLTPAELAEMRRHPRMGWNMLKELKQLKYVLPGVVTHHERFDGKGYPDGLAGEQIPLEGRILAVADAYDAMVSDRSYRKGMTAEQARDILREGAGAQWDPRIVNAFLAAT